MKNLDSISKRIALASIGICGILLSASVLLFSFGSVSKGFASKTPTIQQKSPASTVVVGEIMLVPVIYKDGGVSYVFWNTLSGKSAKYFWDQTLNAWTKEADKYQLPATPLQ